VGFIFGKWKWCNTCVFLLRIGCGVLFLANGSGVILVSFIEEWVWGFVFGKMEVV